MSNVRRIEKNIPLPKKHWVGNGFHVSQFFPRAENLLQRFSPFILMDYNSPENFPPARNPRGIGPHPHRGFETVTFALQGSVEHNDSEGNHGVIHPGDVQWMTAGSGILHKEYHEKAFSKEGGIFHCIQLWVNLPAKDKMTKPAYQELKSADMGHYELSDGSGALTVVAGEVEGAKGPAFTHSPMNVYYIDLKPGSSYRIKENPAWNLGILILEGEPTVNEEKIAQESFLLFENEEGEVLLNAGDEAVRIFVLAGEDLNEPLVAAGPFVMNTKEELRQASEDYREGRFGSEDF